MSTNEYLRLPRETKQHMQIINRWAHKGLNASQKYKKYAHEQQIAEENVMNFYFPKE